MLRHDRGLGALNLLDSEQGTIEDATPAEFFQPLDLLQGRLHGQLARVSCIHARDEGIDDPLKRFCSQVPGHELFHALLLVLGRPTDEAQGAKARTDATGDGEEVKEGNVAQPPGEGVELLLPVDETRQGGIGEDQVIGQAHVHGGLHEGVGGLERIRTLFPQELPVGFTNHVATHHGLGLRQQALDPGLVEVEGSGGATDPRAYDEHVGFFHLFGACKQVLKNFPKHLAKGGGGRGRGGGGCRGVEGGEDAGALR
eukprot:evm.model.NODE_23073_length_9847_cov_24.724382.3